MPTKKQVRALLGNGLDYEAAGRKLGIPAGQAYLIATGVAADGGDTVPDAEMSQRGLLSSSQHLSNPPHENPATREVVREWIAVRVAADDQMRAAARRSAADRVGKPE